MSLDEEEGRPGREAAFIDEQAGGRVVETSVRHPYLVAVEMLAGSADRERAIFEMAWQAGYRTGFESGTEVGYGQAETDMERAWSKVAAKVRGFASDHDLERRRWDGRREDFGRPRPGDYLGGPVDWNGSAGRGAA